MFAQDINNRVTSLGISMITFKYFTESVEVLSEESKMSGSVNDSEKKGIRHLRNYVMPYLSKSQKRSTLAAFARHMNPADFDKEHGSEHDPANPDKPTHTLRVKEGAHGPGTQVTATGAYYNDKGTIMIKTKQHGDIPQSKLGKPASLAKEAITKEGFDVEGKIATNFGTKAAGSTGTAFDFVSHDEGTGGKATKNKRLQGKVKEAADDAEQIETPFTRLQGESKLDRGKMGQSACNFNKEKGRWELTHPKLAKHFAKVKVQGKPLLQHLNENYPDGIISKGFSVPAPRGMTRNYLEGSDVNSLHIHNKKTGKGTTFTIGDGNPLIGKTTLGHMTNRDIDRLDGTINIATTTTGKTQVIHRPHQPTMRSYADLSTTSPELHRDLTDPKHAVEVKKLLDKHRATLSENVSQLFN